MRILPGIAVLLILVGASAAAQAPPRRGPPSCATGSSGDAVLRVEETGELALASGRTAVLAGLRLPEAGEAERGTALAWLREAIGRPAEIRALSEADRWGRTAAAVIVEHEGGPLDLGRSLVAAGLAVVDAGAADILCTPGHLAVEARARDGGLGLWRGTRYTPLGADDLAALNRGIGAFALVEGRVRSVGERKARTYLNFGRDWKTDLTITIPQQTWTILRARGVTAASLRGRRIRARGTLEAWGGPALTVTAADLLELLNETPAPRP